MHYRTKISDYYKLVTVKSLPLRMKILKIKLSDIEHLCIELRKEVTTLKTDN